MGDLHERTDIQTMGNVHHLSSQVEPYMATSKGMGSDTHHSLLGPPKPDLDIHKWGTT
jgi:hypothetical protein